LEEKAPIHLIKHHQAIVAVVDHEPLGHAIDGIAQQRFRELCSLQRFDCFGFIRKRAR
jgi:hypothetical protein